MKTNRSRKTPPLLQTREEMEILVGEIAALKSTLRLLTVAMDEELQSVRGQYEPQLAAQTEALEEKMEQTRLWSEAHPQEFGAARSLETLHGVVGWRTGGPALRTLSGWTWDKVKETLKTAGALGYLRVKEEVNKQSLISDREALGPEQLRQLGLRVVQEETFFVETKLTVLPELAGRA